MVASRFIALWLVSLALMVGASSALGQTGGTVYDEAGVLTGSQEQKVQKAFDATEQESGQPIYAFLVPDTGVDTTRAGRIS